MNHRNIRGVILYTSKKPERFDQPRGSEHFHFTHHGDGKVSLRAHCEIEEPAPTVMRDVIYSVDEAGQPMDCHVRLTVGDAFMGSGWFRFSPAEIECESWSPALGRISQRMPLEAPLDGFGTHPVVADGYLLSRLSWREGEIKKLRVMMPSPDLRGASPPLLVKAAVDARYLGKEAITVKAGAFQARHFQFLDDGTAGFASQHPTYDVWITDDEDGIMLQGGVGGAMLTWYELISLER